MTLMSIPKRDFRTFGANVLSTLLVASIFLSSSQSLAKLDCKDALGPTGQWAQGILLDSITFKSTDEVVARLEHLETVLYTTSGFKSKAEILATARKAGGDYARAADILMGEKLEIATAIRSTTRDLIAKNGFLNFRESGHSEAGATRNRDRIEGNYLGVVEPSYEAVQASLKPKSAYLSPVPGSGLKAPITIDAYGDDHYIFKLSALRQRISLTAGDSLNRRVSIVGDPMDGVKEIKAWDQIYTPWSQRELIIPLLARALSVNKLGVYLHMFSETTQEVESWPYSHKKRLIPITTNPDPTVPVLFASGENNAYQGEGAFANYHASWGTAMDYIEVQIWGSLTMDDVSAFEYTVAPPTGAFLAELQRRGIEIRDGRPKK